MSRLPLFFFQFWILINQKYGEIFFLGSSLLLILKIWFSDRPARARVKRTSLTSALWCTTWWWSSHGDRKKLLRLTARRAIRANCLVYNSALPCQCIVGSAYYRTAERQNFDVAETFFCRILFNSHCYFYSLLQSFLDTFQRSQSFRYFHFQQRGKRLSAVPSTGCVCIWLGCKSQGEFLQKYNQTNLLTLLPCDCSGHDSSRKASRHSPHASFVTILTLEDYFILTNSLPSLFVLILFLTRLLFLFCVF